jgi:phospholipase C
LLGRLFTALVKKHFREAGNEADGMRAWVGRFFEGAKNCSVQDCTLVTEVSLILCNGIDLRSGAGLRFICEVLMAIPGPIRRVVIFFKENHAFDNYFGTFPGANGATMAHSPNPPTHDPNHTHKGWLKRATGAVRQQFLESDIPAYFAYARQFTLCDNYFTDVAGPSTPNHLMVLTADSPIIDNPSGNPVYDLPSLPASLDAAGLTWTTTVATRSE